MERMYHMKQKIFAIIDMLIPELNCEIQILCIGGILRVTGILF